MPAMKQYAFPGFGQKVRESRWFSTAVRTGDQIHCAGQGGHVDGSGTMSSDLIEQIDMAFENVDKALKDAGGKGWSQVYRINSFHIQLHEVVQEAMVRNFKKWMGESDNHPTWTCVQVGRLGQDDMLVEIEVSAFDPEGAKKEGTH